MSIDKNEEEFLRQWDKADPIDQEEKDLNESIYAIQGNRNPFIDIPNLADNIDRFN
jgi:deoxyribonuclease-1